jgi:hypothetical protein
MIFNSDGCQIMAGTSFYQNTGSLLEFFIRKVILLTSSSLLLRSSS